MSGIFDGNVLGSRGLGAVGSCGCGLGTNESYFYQKGYEYGCQEKSTGVIRGVTSWAAMIGVPAGVAYESFKSGYAAGKNCEEAGSRNTGIDDPARTYDAGDDFVPSDLPAPYNEGDACKEKHVVQYVQGVIGTKVDGQWGPKSAAALKASGKTFEQIAVGCRPPAPTYTSGGGTSVTPATTPPPDAPENQAGFSDLFSKIPTVAWVGVAGIAGLLLLRSMKKKQRGTV